MGQFSSANRIENLRDVNIPFPQNVTSSLVVPPWEAKTKQYEDEGAFGEDGLPTADEDERVCKARCVEKYDATEYHIVAVKKLDRKLARTHTYCTSTLDRINERFLENFCRKGASSSWRSSSARPVRKITHS